MINRPDRPILMKNVRESCVLTVLTRIHNIGHIHNTNFAQSQFSMSYPQKRHFLRSQEITFFQKYLVCGFKIEISEYPKNLLYVTYSPYKYELPRTKTHEDRANQKSAFLFSGHCIVIPPTRVKCRICLLYTSPSPRDRSVSRMPSSA